MPRGCLEDIESLLEALKVEVHIRDERISGTTIYVAFHGELRSEQETAARKLLRRDTGVLAVTTAFGKTVVATRMIAERGVNTLVQCAEGGISIGAESVRSAGLFHGESAKLGVLVVDTDPQKPTEM